MITVIARSKVNLFLHVTGKRGDGYHLLESLVVFPKGGDRITVMESDDLTLELTGPNSKTIGNTEENLVLKAARLLREESKTSKGAQITLEKNLPVAAGIGGGSADAAVTLKALNHLWNIGFSDEKLRELGLTLGADIPACLYGKPAIMSGIGEQIAGLSDFPEFSIILVNPGILVETKEVFSQLKIAKNAPRSGDLNGLTARELFIRLSSLRNDLEIPALEIAPEIGGVLSAIREKKGCHLARMSGSGATCFGLFEDEKAAQAAAQAIRTYHPDWWVQATVVGP